MEIQKFNQFINESFEENYYAQYTRIFQIGYSKHKVSIFKTYTKEEGLKNEVDSIESGRITDISKYIKKYVTKEQLKGLIQLMREKADGIIAPDGEYFKY